MPRQRRGEQMRAQSLINSYLIRDCQCSGSLIGWRPGAELSKAITFTVYIIS